ARSRSTDGEITVDFRRTERWREDVRRGCGLARRGRGLSRPSPRGAAAAAEQPRPTLQYQQIAFGLAAGSSSSFPGGELVADEHRTRRTVAVDRVASALAGRPGDADHPAVALPRVVRAAGPAAFGGPTVAVIGGPTAEQVGLHRDVDLVLHAAGPRQRARGPGPHAAAGLGSDVQDPVGPQRVAPA